MVGAWRHNNTVCTGRRCTELSLRPFNDRKNEASGRQTAFWLHAYGGGGYSKFHSIPSSERRGETLWRPRVENEETSSGRWFSKKSERKWRGVKRDGRRKGSSSEREGGRETQVLGERGAGVSLPLCSTWTPLPTPPPLTLSASLSHRLAPSVTVTPFSSSPFHLRRRSFFKVFYFELSFHCPHTVIIIIIILI